MLIVTSTVLLKCISSQNPNPHQFSYKTFNNSILISKLLPQNVNSEELANNILNSSPKRFVNNLLADNQSIVSSDSTNSNNLTISSDKNSKDQSIKDRTSGDTSVSGSKLVNKFVNKSNGSQKKNQLLLKKSLERKEEILNANTNSSDDWMCPNITHNRNLECGCDIKYTLRCSGDVHGLELIADGLRKSNYTVSLLDCTLKNVTVLSDARIFENVTLHGLFISSGEIKRVHRFAFAGLKNPLQILGLPNNALTIVPSTSLQPLTSLDRLDLSNNKIKSLTSNDFVVSTI